MCVCVCGVCVCVCVLCVCFVCVRACVCVLCVCFVCVRACVLPLPACMCSACSSRINDLHNAKRQNRSLHLRMYVTVPRLKCCQFVTGFIYPKQTTNTHLWLMATRYFSAGVIVHIIAITQGWFSDTITDVLKSF